MTSHDGPRKVRDFIYVDQGRLYSFYSQLNKGIAEQIFQSVIHGESSVKTQDNPEVPEEVAESQRSRELQRTESTILYDYMYEQLEQQLHQAITDVAGLWKGGSFDDLTGEELSANFAAYYEGIDNAFLIKAKGRVEIEDYGRLDTFLENSNELMIAFTNLLVHSDENRALVQELQQKLHAERDRNKKAAIKSELKKLVDSELRAQAMGLLTDDEVIHSFITILKTFFGEGMEICVTPNTLPHSTFRSVVNRKWLRMEPDHFRSLYSGAVKGEWTIVGQVTSSIRFNLDNFDSLNFGLSPEAIANAKSVREPIRALFGRVRAMEEMLNYSALRREIVVHPLAIYREMEIPR